MLRAAFYIRIARNRIDVRNIGTGETRARAATRPFTTARLLVGDFVAADELLRSLVDEVRGSPLAVRRRFVMHALEMTDGGLSPVEERVLLELAASAGARHAVTWVGPELSDDEARAKLSAA